MDNPTESKGRRFYWQHCYQLGNKDHWALCDSLTDSERSGRVTCLEMILEETRPNPRNNRPLSEEFFPRLIVQLLNEHYERAGDSKNEQQIQTMKPHQARVVGEKSELDEKRQKLTAFIGGETYRTLDSAEQSRLNRQLEAMTLYSHILAERIAAFPP